MKGKLVSSDNEATVENELLAPKELAVERVITNVFSKLQCYRPLAVIVF